MAKKAIVTLIDDITGQAATQTISFSLDGRDFTIDLDDTNAALLRGGLEKFVAAATPSKRTTRHGAPPAKEASVSDASAIREWARSQNITVSPRGRISADIRASYYAGNPQN